MQRKEAMWSDADSRITYNPWQQRLNCYLESANLILAVYIPRGHINWLEYQISIQLTHSHTHTHTCKERSHLYK